MNDLKKYKPSIINSINLKIIIINSVLCILVLTIYISSDIRMTASLYLVLAFLSVKYKLIPFFVLGAGNYLPLVDGISPVFIAIILLCMVTICECIKEKTIKIPSTRFPIMLLSMITIWSCITALIYKDISFFKNMLMIDVFYIVVIFYCANTKVSSNEILNNFIWGVMFGVILAAFIKANIPGFTSNHIYRLAIGERSDPNSTGLLFAISSTFLFLKMLQYMKKYVRLFLLFTGLFACSLFCMILTQSRGSFLTLLITIGIYIWGKKERIGETVREKTLINISILLGAGLIVLVSFPNLITMVRDVWVTLLERLSIENIGGGARLYLFIMSIRSFLAHPVFGNDLNTFEMFAGHIPHNTFSDYMVTNGIIGIMFFLLFFVMPLIKNYKYRKVPSVSEPYFCYMACMINILCYSASNEKISYLLSIIVLLAINEKNYYLNNRKEVESEKKYFIARSN